MVWVHYCGGKGTTKTQLLQRVFLRMLTFLRPINLVISLFLCNFAGMKAQGSVVMLLILVLTACYSGQRRAMLALLDEADSLNRAYAPLPSDSLLRRAADFFDRHGTRNDQVRAHYLLGCAYRDQGQAPEALQSYQDAIDRADTLSTDSIHNAILCRVHSQMAYLFYQQNLVSNQLEHIDSSISYALKAGDSVAALNSYMFTMGAYIRMGVDDSVMAVCDRAYNLCQELGQRKMIAQNAIVAVPKFLSAGQYQKSAFYLDLYEKESGFFDSEQNIAKGREVYYYLKGLYYLHTNQKDSAEFFFRKELSEGKDFNNQNYCCPIKFPFDSITIRNCR